MVGHDEFERVAGGFIPDLREPREALNAVNHPEILLATRCECKY